MSPAPTREPPYGACPAGRCGAGSDRAEAAADVAEAADAADPDAARGCGGHAGGRARPRGGGRARWDPELRHPLVGAADQPVPAGHHQTGRGEGDLAQLGRLPVSLRHSPLTMSTASAGVAANSRPA